MFLHIGDHRKRHICFVLVNFDRISIPSIIQIYITHEYSSCVTIVAEQGQALWQFGNRVLINNIGMLLHQRIKKLCPFMIAHSGSSESSHLDLIKQLNGFKVNEGNFSQSPSQTDACHVHLLSLREVLFHLSNIFNNL